MGYCEEVLIKDLRVENVVKFIQFAERYDASEFRQSCLVFAAKNYEEVFKLPEIKELDNESLLEIVKLKK